MSLLNTHNFLPKELLTLMCDVCGIITSSLVNLNQQMKNIHSETDSERLNRSEQLLMSHILQKKVTNKIVKDVSIYDCSECGIIFDKQGHQKEHNEKYHKSEVVVIEPDTELLTQNTKDLEEMLRLINKESLYPLCSDEFDVDFNEILNKKVDIEKYETSDGYRCDDCKFKAGSQKVLNTHYKFVHDLSFYACDFCKTKTKTIGAMKLHSQIIHQNKNVTDNTNIDSGEEETKIIEEDVLSEDEDNENTDDEDEINIDYEHIVDDESGAESYKGTKPCFVETVKAVKVLLQEKVGGYIKKINNHNMVVRDVRSFDYGVEADIEISKGRL